jgi:hypothetical protein
MIEGMGSGFMLFCHIVLFPKRRVVASPLIYKITLGEYQIFYIGKYSWKCVQMKIRKKIT